MDDEDDAGAAELNALTARTHSIMEKKLSVSSRRTYHASLIRLLLWWFEKRPALLMDAFRLELASHAAQASKCYVHACGTQSSFGSTSERERAQSTGNAESLNWPS